MICLVLLAGLSTGENSEDNYPLALTEFEGVTFIQKLFEKLLGVKGIQIVTLIKDQDLKKYNLDRIIKLLDNNSVVISSSTGTRGAPCTALLAIDYINDGEELLIVNGDEILTTSYTDLVQDFRSSNACAGLVAFDSIHPRYSYAKLDASNFALETSEKRPISRNALAGFYWYRKGSDFVTSATKMIEKSPTRETQFYMSLTFNQLILSGEKVLVKTLGKDVFHPIKSGWQARQFDNSISRNDVEERYEA